MATKTANVTARVPFSLDIPDKLATRDSITQAEFDTMMQTGLAQAKRIDAVLRLFGSVPPLSSARNRRELRQHAGRHAQGARAP